MDQEDKPTKKSPSTTDTSVLLASAARAMADIMVGSTFPLIRLSWPQRKSVEAQKTALVKDLLEAGIDPLVFDSLLSNEIDRRLKVRFGNRILVPHAHLYCGLVRDRCFEFYLSLGYL